MKGITKEHLEKFYNKKDPWNYKSNEDDSFRKKEIISVIPKEVKTVIDIGCGEGYITDDIKKDRVVGVDISSKALERSKTKEKYCLDIFNDDISFLGKFDLVLICGITYFANKKDIEKIISISNKYILSCHLTENDYGKNHFDMFKNIYDHTFPYRGMTEELILYKL